MPRAKRARKGMWMSMSINRIVGIFQILKWLDEMRVLEEGKHVSYFGDCLTPENFMEYAQDVADNDKIWDKLPESWKVEALISKESQKGMIKHLNRTFGIESGIRPSKNIKLRKDGLRKELRFLLTLCDANLKTYQKYEG